ncbi:SurA N-terminal domain-containing protein [Bacillus shivajii]|uniref:SurA N-terminal domain-containing protein n=1 Tax=Bacillus shivajii TaxID=1983719 RepID=UPI001CFAF68C|nr:SurA N-terminal domain-containing protein [Bacillus shivajii]UCZ52855.1 SurA N-terminal domain-containing protein [Bacillus shivajii]
MKKKWFLSLSLATLVAVSTACGDVDETEEGNNEGIDTQEEEPAEDSEAAIGGAEDEMPQPDLDGIPDVVAEVNGEEILRDEFVTAYEGQYMQAMMQAQMTGQEIDEEQLKAQIADSMVGQQLLIQEAERSSIEVSDEEVNALLAELAAQNGLGSEEEFLAALEEQGMSEEEVMTQIELQVKIDEVIANEAGNIELTDEELEEAYDMMVAQQSQMGEEAEAEMPSFEEMKPEIEQQLMMQKEAEVTQALVERLREDADVTVHL